MAFIVLIASWVHGGTANPKTKTHNNLLEIRSQISFEYKTGCTGKGNLCKYKQNQEILWSKLQSCDHSLNWGTDHFLSF
jgi:hypothetical protein